MDNEDFTFSTEGLDWSPTPAQGTYTINVGNDLYSTNDNGLTVSWPEESSKDDIVVDGKSLKTFMDKVEKRLAILQPNPEKLKKFEALQKAYEHYKTIEALCDEEEEQTIVGTNR